MTPGEEKEGGRRWNLKGTFLPSYNTVFVSIPLYVRPKLSTRGDSWCFQWLTGKEFTEDTPGENMNEGIAKEKNMTLHQN